MKYITHILVARACAMGSLIYAINYQQWTTELPKKSLRYTTLYYVERSSEGQV